MSISTQINAWSLRARASHVGRGVRIRGVISADVFGELTIGDDVQLGGVAATTHLVSQRGAHLRIGARSIIGHGSGLSALAGISLGEDVHIGPFCLVLDSDFHVVGDFHRAPEPKPIVIGDGVRIGANVVVLRGSDIGAGAQVLAGSMVTGTVAPHTIVGGVRARVLSSSTTAYQTLFPDDRTLATVSALLAHTLGTTQVIKESTELRAIDGWSESSYVNVLLAIEVQLGIALSVDALASCGTMGALVQLIQYSTSIEN